MNIKQRLINWMRVVLPDTWIVSFCILTEMLLEITYLLCLWWAGQVDEVAFGQIRLLLLGFWSLLYGSYRATAFHPALNEEYRHWLELTPWTPGKPLPDGPIRQMPQDLIVLGVLMLLARATTLQVLYLPAAYLFGYLTSLAIASRVVGDWVFAYLLAFGLGAIVYEAKSPEICLAVAMGCYPVAFLAIRRSLASFPWNIDWAVLKNQFKKNLEEKHQDRLGWPFDFLSPKPPKRLLPYSDGICLSLLAGWYMFVFHTNITPFEQRAGFEFIAFQVIAAGMGSRVWDYVRAHRPPLSLGGRFWSGRWIIPSYDVIFVAPLLALVILLASQIGAAWLFLVNGPLFVVAVNPQLEALAIGLSASGIAVAIFLLCVVGPEVERWRLVGTHRIVFDLSGFGSKSKQSQFVEL